MWEEQSARTSTADMPVAGYIRNQVSSKRLNSLKPFISATLVIALAAAIAPLLQRLPHANLSLLFMTGVLIVAVRSGLWPSIYASILSFLVFNFLFTSPYLTLAVSEEGDIATLAFFLIMASLTGNLAARLRDALANREAAVQHTASLQSLTRLVAGSATTRQVLQTLVQRLAETFDCRIVAQLTDATPPELIASGDDAAPAESMDQLSPDEWTLVPLESARGQIGTVAIGSAPLAPETLNFAEALIDQAAVALERTILVAELEKATLVSERERLRSALLSSVSHDLRTPLSSIIGAASTLIEYGGSIEQRDQSTLLQSIQDEANRLDRHIQNLLDMTRLDHGHLTIERDWQDIRDLVSAALRRLNFTQKGFNLDVDVAEEAQLVNVNGDLMEQVFVNLFDNITRHAPGSAGASMNVYRDGDSVVIDLTDSGPGIALQDLERVFEPFYRIQGRDRHHGSGLGLSICRGIIQLHGGRISAHPGPQGGTLMRIRLHQPADATEDLQL